MTRIDYRPWGAVVLSTVVLAYVGCNSSAPTSAPSPAPSADSKAEQATEKHGEAATSDSAQKPSKLFADWPKPLATLVISGQRYGYIEPCGCTKGQLGGMIRVYDFAERLRKQEWPMTSIDLGSLVKNPAASRGGLEQSKIKFNIALQALTTLGTQALALSVDDLKLGVGEAMSQFMNLDKGPKVVVANVTPMEGFETKVVPTTVVTTGSVKFGITSVIDPKELESLNDPDKAIMLPKVEDPEKVLPGVLAELEKTSDVQVLMVQGSAEMAKALGKANPGFDIIVPSSEYPDPPADPETINDGKTFVVTVGQKGKYVGAVGVFPADSEKRLRYQRVSLLPTYDGPATAMKKLVQDQYRETLKSMKIVEDFPRHAFVNGAPGAKFVGAENCKGCHPKTYEKWESSKHALSFESLVNDPKPNTIYDAECISCHTVGFEYTTGYVSEEKTPLLLGNQCENCHGPGSKHSADPTNADYLKFVSVTKETADRNGQCTHCHDEDNSPGFTDFTIWWDKIKHDGLDDYSDPKVRKGIAEKVVGDAKAKPSEKTSN